MDSPFPEKIISKSELEIERGTSDVLRHVMDPVFITGPGGDLNYTNPAFEKMFSSIEWRSSKIFRAVKENIIDKGNSSEVSKIYTTLQQPRIKFVLLPLVENNELRGVAGVGKLESIKDIYRLVHSFRDRNYEKYVEIRFKPKRKLPEPMQQIAGNNIDFIKTLHKASISAKTDLTVVIYGESGVGKQLLAEAIHRSSGRAKAPFVEVNCAAIPDHLFESEMFGYDSHSFTDASRFGKTGKFEVAHGGTIFLDEVGELSLTMQAKLLRFIQFKEFERVGGSQVKVDTRVIAATNKPLFEMVEKGEFREDLYYRLNVFPLVLTPLKARKDDLDIIVDNTIEKLKKRYKGGPEELTTEVIMCLYHYDWPGNIRQLENALEYAFISAKFEGGREIGIEHLPEYLVKERGHKPAGGMPGNGRDLKSAVKEVEKEYIQKTLAECNFNRSLAIKKLGISRGKFYKKLKEHF